MSDVWGNHRAEAQAMVALTVLGVLITVLLALIVLVAGPVVSRMVKQAISERASEAATARSASGKPLPPGATPAHLQVDLGELFSPDRYPEAAAAAGEQGRVGMTLRISRSGNVRRCTINASSGSRALDAASCQIILRQGRYDPARDRQGRPIASDVRLGVRWRLSE